MQEKKFTYHWAIVIAVFLMFAASVGILVNCFSVFGPAIMKDTGFTASQVQLINLVCTFANLIGGALIGKIMAKFGMRLTLPVYTILMCAGLAMRSTSATMLSFCLWAFIAGIGLSGVSMIPGSMLINNWFTEKKGTATGIAFTGSVAGGLIFVQISKNFIESVGWRTANIYISIIAAAILLPTVLFVVKEKPADKGLLPLGADAAELASAKAKVTGIALKPFLKTSAFWILAIASFSIGFCNLGMQNNLTICLESELGHSASFAANVFTIVMGVQIVGKILLGAIYDRKGVKFGTFYNLILYLLVVDSALMAGSVPMAIAYGALFGLLSSMTTVTPPYITALIVGRKHYSTIYGILSLFFGLGCAFGPLMAGAIFDATGSYSIAWFVFAGISVLLAVTTLLSVKKGAGYSEIND